MTAHEWVGTTGAQHCARCHAWPGDGSTCRTPSPQFPQARGHEERGGPTRTPAGILPPAGFRGQTCYRHTCTRPATTWVSHYATGVCLPVCAEHERPDDLTRAGEERGTLPARTCLAPDCIRPARFRVTTQSASDDFSCLTHLPETMARWDGHASLLDNPKPAPCWARVGDESLCQRCGCDHDATPLVSPHTNNWRHLASQANPTHMATPTCSMPGCREPVDGGVRIPHDPALGELLPACETHRSHAYGKRSSTPRDLGPCSECGRPATWEMIGKKPTGARCDACSAREVRELHGLPVGPLPERMKIRPVLPPLCHGQMEQSGADDMWRCGMCDNAVLAVDVRVCAQRGERLQARGPHSFSSCPMPRGET